MSMFFPRIYETTLKTGDTTNHSLVNEGTRPFTKKKTKVFQCSSFALRRELCTHIFHRPFGIVGCLLQPYHT